MDLLFKLLPIFSDFSSLLVFLVLIFFFSCWIKISTVLGVLRLGLGFTGLPSLTVISALSIALTLFVMSPSLATLSSEIDSKLKSYNVNSFDKLQVSQQSEIYQTLGNSWLTFLNHNTNKSDLERFASIAMELSGSPEMTPELISSWRVVAPAFIVSEITKAFKIAFSIFLPFLIIDLVIATILASVELGNLDSQIVALPFKLLLFVTIDGWGLIAGNLVKTYVV